MYDPEEALEIERLYEGFDEVIAKFLNSIEELPKTPETKEFRKTGKQLARALSRVFENLKIMHEEFLNSFDEEEKEKIRKQIIMNSELLLESLEIATDERR